VYKIKVASANRRGLQDNKLCKNINIEKEKYWPQYRHMILFLIRKMVIIVNRHKLRIASDLLKTFK